MAVEKFNSKVTYSVSMVMRIIPLSRQTIIRYINELKIVAHRTCENGPWLMEGSDLNTWWNSLPTNISEFESIRQESTHA